MTTRTNGGGSGSACSSPSVLGLVMCGGQSQRMGVDKALVQLGGRRLLDYGVEALNGIASEVRLATGSAPRYADLQLACVLDERVAGAAAAQARGPLAGLVAGLRSAAADGFELLAVSACDTPRVSAHVFELLLRQLRSSACDAVLLGTHKAGQLFPEPLIAIYRVATCLAPARTALEQGQRKLTSFHGALQVELLDEHVVPTAEPARNLNTPLDLEAEEVLLRTRRQEEPA